MRIVVATTPTGIQMGVVAADDDRDPPMARAWVLLRRDGEHEWALTGIDTKTEFERRGYGRALVETVRAWAAEHGVTVYTDTVASDKHGFYQKTGCVWLPDRDEYLVAPAG